MEPLRRAIRRGSGAARILPLILLALAACSRRGHSVAFVSGDSFRLDLETTFRDGSDRYDWMTTKTEARLEFRVRHFSCGSCRVSVFDGIGRKILDRRFGEPCDFLCADGDEYLAIAFTARGAASGRWTILIDFDDFCGHLYLVLE